MTLNTCAKGSKKANGPDGLVSELYHAYPKQMAQVPLVAKMILHCMDPLERGKTCQNMEGQP